MKIYSLDTEQFEQSVKLTTTIYQNSPVKFRLLKICSSNKLTVRRSKTQFNFMTVSQLVSNHNCSTDTQAITSM